MLNVTVIKVSVLVKPVLSRGKGVMLKDTIQCIRANDLEKKCL